MPKHPVSLVIISLNEEANIERCIRSAPWVNDVVVLDSGSSDRTQEIARSLGARVFAEPFRGFRDQKQRATDLANNNWILSLDADEALSDSASRELEQLVADEQQLNKFDGIEMPRLSFHMGRWIKHGGWYPDKQLRLFNRKSASWGKGHVHERVEAKRVSLLRSDLLHYPFGSLSEQIRTNNEYSSLGARDLFDQKKKFSVLKLIFKPWSKFLETYFVKRGFQDGMPGFIIAVGAAYSVFLKFSKLRELEEIK